MVGDFSELFSFPLTAFLTNEEPARFIRYAALASIIRGAGIDHTELSIF
jgi:hypothetical protein